MASSAEFEIVDELLILVYVPLIRAASYIIKKEAGIK